MRVYTVQVHGLPHTIQLSDEDAAALGDAAVPVKVAPAPPPAPVVPVEPVEPVVPVEPVEPVVPEAHGEKAAPAPANKARTAASKKE